jgi:glutathione synthase/RimK-type ligase-like ATP-grasp enzyme
VRYVLLITETSDLAADLLILGARERDVHVVRFNQDEFPRQARIQWRSEGQTLLLFDERCFAEDEISGAWFRRAPNFVTSQDQTTTFAARETAGYLKGVWETTAWAWMNLPSAIARAEHKLLQLRCAQQLGLSVPDTLATNCPEGARSFARDRNIVAKTVVGAGLTVNDIDHAIFTTGVTLEDLSVDGEIQACPIIFQNHIHTQFDLRVTVVGTQIFAARIIVRDRTEMDVDWRKVDPARVSYERELLPRELEVRCSKLIAAFGLMYGALDFVVTPEGEHVFLELNPSGQWGWIERALQMPITNAILDTLMDNCYA